MLATTPTGSRRTIDVWPSRYSVTARPSGTRQAPAKKRNRSELVVISSIAAPTGLPVEDVRDLEQRQAAGLRRREAPGLERGFCRVHRAVHVRLARGRDVRDHGPVG